MLILCLLPSNFIKNETPAQVFSCEFCKIFKNTYFSGYLQGAASNSIVTDRFFCKIKKEKDIKDCCFLKMSVNLFNVFNESKDNYDITTIYYIDMVRYKRSFFSKKRWFLKIVETSYISLYSLLYLWKYLISFHD